MKKVFLTTIALLSIASASVFGMYGVNSGDWIGFLTHGNQFRARVQQLGFTLGNDTIKGTFGFFNNGRGAWGSMLSANTNEVTTAGTSGRGLFYDFTPTISMGLAYTSSLISVGVGYNATIGKRWTKIDGKKTEAVVHTPVLVLNAMDNAFRMAIPIQVVNLTDKATDGKGSVTAVSLEAQFRYYSGLDFLPQIRLLIKYGNYGAQLSQGGNKQKITFAESFGFEFRLYFGAMVEEVALQPFVKLVYNGALGKQHNKTGVTALSALNDSAGVPGNLINPNATALSTYSTNAAWKQSAWDLTLAPALGITANSDIVSLYVEPSLGLKITQEGSATDSKVKELYGLAWGTYAEIYITPIKNLEWYFEADVGNDANKGGTPVKFAASTGITWYLPAL
ncbi:cell surface protein [uncultured Brachyspira sp.]|uniref:cell surface protein n=1 Tax=uncultured Brachyspira sp. TaxID=221953 RepID=UPI00259143FB|nr:cell surface protein [uncultured Brachyspira sp.]